jgi:DNA-binding transcriptional ArsR family regulator
LHAKRRPRRASEESGAASLFAALGDAKRLWLVAKLSGSGPLSIASLTEGSNVTRQGITKHLRVMEAAALVSSLRVGREVLWQVHPRRLHDAQSYLDNISKQWDAALARLKKFVEE